MFYECYGLSDTEVDGVIEWYNAGCWFEPVLLGGGEGVDPNRPLSHQSMAALSHSDRCLMHLVIVAL